ncbi:hypothetical protein E6C76_10970 [Pseudothauera nasutitermitis]|uniref:Uncharacterized protein n=1 Tax=Pseudothauera nasutitermitis TaxID=2565930 RepID=A0A4S4B124_9RHOO|nr:hypothetical protein [Pseudothauera nasutitermitis]THF64578.1 hypothetical protein E6C76_10970 [Pseudothauera nasutitermitis]
MFEELGISSAFADIYSEMRARTKTGGREIDAAFIERGFATVACQIEYWNRCFGAGSYDLYIDVRTDSEKFISQRDHDQTVSMSFHEAYKRDGFIPESCWPELRDDPLVSAHNKVNLCQLYFKSIYAALKADEATRIEAAVAETQQRICSLYPPPATLLYDKETIPLRKQIYNAVAADAYGALGFVKFKRKSGTDVFHKPLSDEVSIIVELDTYLFSKVSERCFGEYDENGRMRLSDRRNPIQLNGEYMLGHFDGKRYRRLMSFVPQLNCLSATAGTSFYDTSSLEVSIRARALWYELTVEPSVEAMRRVLAEGGQAHAD